MIWELFPDYRADGAGSVPRVHLQNCASDTVVGSTGAPQATHLALHHKLPSLEVVSHSAVVVHFLCPSCLICVGVALNKFPFGISTVFSFLKSRGEYEL